AGLIVIVFKAGAFSVTLAVAVTLLFVGCMAVIVAGPDLYPAVATPLSLIVMTSRSEVFQVTFPFKPSVKFQPETRNCCSWPQMNDASLGRISRLTYSSGSGPSPVT